MGARALLRSSALVLALAASLAPPVLPAAVAATAKKPVKPAAKAPAPPLQIRVGRSDGFSRIQFHWTGAVGFTARREGDNLVVRFSRDADPDMSLLSVDPPPFLKTAVLRRRGRVLEIVLTLLPDADFKTGTDDGDLFVNLFSTKPVEAKAAVPARADPRPASGVVRMQGEIASGQVLLHFPWKSPLGAAVFRRGEAVWLVFDTPVKLDVAGAPAQTSVFKGLQVVNGPDFSAVRIASPSIVPVKAWADGAIWTVALGAGVQKPAAPVKAVRDPQNLTPSLQADMAGATKVVWIGDPVVGDRIAAVTALGPSKGVGGRRAYVDLTLLPSAQGMALEPKAPDLTLAIDGEWVRISRPKGLTLSSVTATAGRKSGVVGLPQAASMPALIDYVGWSRTGDGGFMARYSELQNAAADEMSREAGGDKQAGVNARMGLARFLAGSQLSFETIGVLNLLGRRHPEMMGDPEFRGIRGAARAMAGRYKEAENDFSVPTLADDPASALWRGYIAAMQNDWPAAKDGFVKGASALNQFPAAWQSRFARAYADTALELNQLNVASTEVALSIAQTNDPIEQLATRLVQARLIEAQGYPQRALALFDAVARAPLDKLASPARMHAAQLRLSLGQISPNQAVQVYDSLRFRWRGDRVEVELIRNLGQLYLDQGHYREALETLRSIADQRIVAPEMQDVQADLGRTFRALFLDGQADGMEPVQALALFYDFKNLTPLGADGDLMVRKLARRLVDVDLLDQAAELLKYQTDNRLDGAAKAQVATDLATLYLMARKPEQAIQAINDSRTTILSPALQEQRRMIEARAWLALNQNDHALELVAKTNSADADGIRAEVAWRSHQWAPTGALLEKILGDRWTNAAPLATDEEAMLLRAGIAYSLAADDAALERLRTRYQGLVGAARAADALRVALAGTAGVEVATRDFGKVAADADIFSGWVSRMKQRFKDAPSPTGAKAKVASAETGAKG
ncbi:MAG: endoglucanase [Caulobacteraceae bacterium]|nr:endoglucanase [Caulobacteraceae bacterium]